jgi:tRNA nucleotidyltransferase (CCA-adding enzyme)
MHYYESRSELLEEMNNAKIECPLVVIDPVQKDRNIASALSNEKYNAFVELCKKVLANPSEEWFKRKEITIDTLESKAADNYLIILKASPLEGKEDVVGCKILKLMDHVKQILKKNDFKIIDSDWEWKNEVLIWFIIDNQPLPKLKIHYGPPLDDQENLTTFKEKWKDYEIQKSHDNKVFVMLERQFMDPVSLIKYILDEDKRIYECCSRIKIKYTNK